MIRGEDADWLEKILLSGKLVPGKAAAAATGGGKNYYQDVSREKNRLVDQLNAREVAMTCLSIELSTCKDLQEMHRMLNLHSLEEQLTPICHQICAWKEQGVFVSFDLDGLKKINDNYGHQAEILQSGWRRSRSAGPRRRMCSRSGWAGTISSPCCRGRTSRRRTGSWRISGRCWKN